MTQLLSAFSGSVLYLDTMIFYAFLREKSPAVEALIRSIANGEFQIVTSALTFDELAHRMLLAEIRDAHGGSPLDVLRKDEKRMLAEFFPIIEPSLLTLYYMPNLTIVDITGADVPAMYSNMRSFQLRPRDALHLAAMQKADCFHLVSQDSDFDHIPAITRYTLA